MKWKIVADSSCDMVDGQLASDNIDFKVVPLKIIVGDNQYIDNQYLDIDEMLDDMTNYKGGSSSACPSVGDFIAEFEAADNVIALTMTSSLSGTYNSAVQAKNIVLEQYPNKNIHIVDSKATSGNLLILARKTLELINSGLVFDEIVKQIENCNSTLRLLFSLSNFDNLVKTGRMSKISGIIASTLGIRAVAEATTDRGEIKVLEKPRGQANALKKIVELMGKQKNMLNVSVVISHCQNFDGATVLKGIIEQTYRIRDITIVEMRGLTSFYSQRNGIIVSF